MTNPEADGGDKRNAPQYRKILIENHIYKGGGAIITPETLNIRIYSSIPPFNSEPCIHIIPADQVEYHDGHFTKLYRRYESKNWRIEEIKPKEKVYEPKQIHPQTGRPIG